MIKKTILAAFLAALALAALPALAAAEETSNPGGPYLEGLQEEEGLLGHFSLSGGAVKWSTASSNLECEKTTGTGTFADKETGSLKLTFHGCHAVFGIPCTSSGEPSGTITTTLPFHLKTVDHEGEHKPGILITPNSEVTSEHFASFSCSFAGNVVVKGNGIIGTITSPGENEKSKTATIKFQSGKSGTQTHRKVTNDATEYDKRMSINGGAFETVSIDAEATLEFTKGEPEIKTTPTE